MRRTFLTLAFLAPLAVAAERTPAPLPAPKAAEAFRVPDGFRVTLFAAEPDIVQPVSFCTDTRGRLFVAEALNYGTWQPTGKDRVVILDDTDGDGKADSRKVFYEGLNYVTGIEVGFGGVWVVSPPGLYFIPDRDGDDVPDGPPELLFDGFGHKESRHNLVNGFTWGPDGWLYGGHGRTSPSEVGRPGTPKDQRIHCDGGVYRIHPTRRVFENFADGTTNPWGVDFDDFGQCFVSNCVNPHLFHMIQGGHYEPWRNRASSLHAYDRLPTIADHWHFPTDKPNAMRGETDEVLAMGGGHAHCGTLVYLADQFPAEFRNSVLLCNVHGRRINHDTLRRKGSGYVASHAADFAVAGDPWFMGVTLRTGPDGGIYVSDWSDTGECHTYKPDKATGRIYRITFGPPGKNPADLASLTDAELVKLQFHRNDWYVRHARRLLQERGSKSVHPALEKELASPERGTPGRLRALWALHVTGGLTPSRLIALLADPSEHLRAWAVQLLCESQPPGEAMVEFARMAKGDPSPVVRLYLASALQRLPFVQRWTIAELLLAHGEDAADPNIPLMLWYAIEPLTPGDPSRVMGLAAKAKIPLVRQYIARRFVENAFPDGTLEALVNTAGESSDVVRLDLFRGAREGLRGRKSAPMPEGWATTYANLSASASAEVRQHAVMLALTFGDPQALIDLRKAARNGEVAAVDALIEKRIPDLAEVLHECLAKPATRRVALRGLASVPHADTAGRVLGLYAKLSTDEKQDAIATLAARKDGAIALLNAIETKAVPRGDVSAFVARQLHALNDRAVSEKLRRVWGEVRESSADKQAQLAKFRSVLTPAYLKSADATKGKTVFAKNCQSCHKLFGEGGAIGPDLTGSNRADVGYVLSNLIDPSAEVGRDYRMSVVATKNGRVITGIIIERTAVRAVVQTATDRVVLSGDDVESVEDSPLSIMPEGVLQTLPKEELRDLMAYLAGKGK